MVFGAKLYCFLSAELNHNIDMPTHSHYSLNFFNYFHIVSAWSSKIVTPRKTYLTPHYFSWSLTKRSKKELSQLVLFKINIIYLNAQCSLLTSLGKALHRDLPCSGLTIPYCLSVLDLYKIYSVIKEEKRMRPGRKFQMARTGYVGI